MPGQSTILFRCGAITIVDAFFSNKFPPNEILLHSRRNFIDLFIFPFTTNPQRHIPFSFSSKEDWFAPSMLTSLDKGAHTHTILLQPNKRRAKKKQQQKLSHRKALSQICFSRATEEHSVSLILRLPRSVHHHKNLWLYRATSWHTGEKRIWLSVSFLLLYFGSSNAYSTK